MALLGWVGSRFWVRLGFITVGLIVGVIALVLTAIDLASPASLLGLQRARVAIGGLPVGARFGLYLALAGSAVAVATAAFWLAATRTWWARPVQAASPAAPASEAPGPAERPTTPLPPMTEPGLASE